MNFLYWLSSLYIVNCLVGAGEIEPVDFIKPVGISNKINRTEKFFPFFSVIRFANDECAGINSFNGTCFTRRECNDLSGTNSGFCASRMGVCCVVQRSCGGSTNVNNTYFTSPQYPGSYAGGTRCTLTVNRCNTGICQLRIDFLDMVLAQPDGDGNCINDVVTITGGSTFAPIICGDNTDQHMYIDFDGDNAITISIDANAQVGFSRRWNLKITQLACNCPSIAPNGCLQYFTGTSGTAISFNFGPMANQALSTSLVTGTRQLVNLNYGVCVRMEVGFCTIQWSSTGGDVYSFTVSGDVEGVDATVLGTDVGASNGVNCLTDFVVIPNPVVVATGAGAQSDRFCGLGFVTVSTGSKPFVLTVVTDGNEGATANTPPDVANRGFSLSFSQLACVPQG